jgi:uncharacterized protein (TIGR03083 family)
MRPLRRFHKRERLRFRRMALSELAPTDTRFLFRPVSSALVSLLRKLPLEDWRRPTVARAWVVRDVVAHLVDLTFRRLSFHRDRFSPPLPSRPVTSEREFVQFINTLNREWVTVAQRFSPRVLTDVFEKASADLADWFETLPLDAPALFGVSWAGEEMSEGWFDIGREFTELWHHQEQIRLAVGAASLPDSRFLRAVIEIALRGLPHAYRHVEGATGCSVAIDVSGPAGGIWTLERDARRWTILAGDPAVATTRVRLSDQTLWKLLFNAVETEDGQRLVQVDGQSGLAAPFLRARSVIV